MKCKGTCIDYFNNKCKRLDSNEKSRHLRFVYLMCKLSFALWAPFVFYISEYILFYLVHPMHAPIQLEAELGQPA